MQDRCVEGIDRPCSIKLDKAAGLESPAAIP